MFYSVVGTRCTTAKSLLTTTLSAFYQLLIILKLIKLQRIGRSYTDHTQADLGYKYIFNI
jgi:hypothetical protein